jgi:hypothetical protein
MRWKPKYWCCASLAASLLVGAVACNSRPRVRGLEPSDEPLALSATAVPTAAPTSAPATPAAEAMKESLEYLASDTLEGRGIGTKGIDLAAAYIAGDFHGAGLRPLPGLKDYFQRFEATTADGIAPETSLAVGGKTLKLNDDYAPLSFSAEKSFEDARLVFVGYGITSAEHKYDDYADVDVHGKVAIAWRFEPVDKEGKSKFVKDDWSDLAHLDAKAKNAAEHGAIGLILVNPPLFKGPDGLLPFARQYQGSSAAIAVLHVTRTVGNELIKKETGQDPAALEAAINETPSPRSQELKGVTASGKVAVKRTIRYLQNVVGYLPGGGIHSDEYVVVGAHYDHLGYGGFGSLAPKSHEIHNGADDNGSGTAAIIELARELGEASQQGKSPSRSIVFVAFSGEEEGLWGSAHFVNHPPVPLRQIVGMLNLDMVGRIRDNTLYVGGAGTAASFDAILKKADEDSPLILKDIGKGGFGPSDHMSFAMKKIPVLFFFSGLHADYHRPTDKIGKINFNGMADAVELSRRVIVAMADMPRQQYVNAADSHSMMGMGSASGGGSGGSRASLGVVPDYTTEQSTIKGVKISGTVPGSPAEKAGLVDGDVLLGFNDKNLDNLMDLSVALGASKPGDKVKLRVKRGAREITTEATLGERKQ